MVIGNNNVNVARFKFDIGSGLESRGGARSGSRVNSVNEKLANAEKDIMHPDVITLIMSKLHSICTQRYCLAHGHTRVKCLCLT
ncbi:hypothetical protein EVAR_34194_1 [Eumeta japonica]|uniref:Uncharacterized protein n=1 Tax=Eumeta variegata TaxID=151549 RepID=A0A4C1WGX3_EUMVA|nr:hypothetical protein EVAR_34194_1 [Eumeta japonica]